MMVLGADERDTNYSVTDRNQRKRKYRSKAINSNTHQGYSCLIDCDFSPGFTQADTARKCVKEILM